MTEENLPSAVVDFFKHKNVFITGATGFVGVAIIEKLLYAIPDIGKIYILLRAKNGKTLERRLEDIHRNSVFNRLRQLGMEERLQKIVSIEGDIGEPGFGISDESLKTLQDNVNIVIHSAATLDFFTSLHMAEKINLQGTIGAANLASQMKNLKAFVHVSSAYANSFLKEVKEELYMENERSQRVNVLLSTLSEEALKELEPKILMDHPNTYTLTKQWAEQEIYKMSTKIPAGIIRPSMITAAWKEPMPGWTVSKNGPQGFFMGASKGVIRRLPLSPDVIMDYIPVDMVVNGIITIAYEVNRLRELNNGKPGELQIFHFTSGTCNPFRFKMLEGRMNDFLHKYPSTTAVWYPNLQMVPNLTMFRLAAILYHFFPGLILDALTKLFGGRPILIRLHRNVWKSLNTLEKFIFSEWLFDNKRTMALSKSMNATDQKMFPIDISKLNWLDYFEQSVLGVREYLNKEPPKTLSAARRKDKILLVLHVALQLLVYYGLWHLVMGVFDIERGLASLVVAIIYFTVNFFIPL